MKKKVLNSEKDINGIESYTGEDAISNKDERLRLLSRSLFRSISYNHNRHPRGDADYQQINSAIIVNDWRKEISANGLLESLRDISQDKDEGLVFVYPDNYNEDELIRKKRCLDLEFWLFPIEKLKEGKVGGRLLNGVEDRHGLLHSPTGKDGGVIIISDFSSLIPEYAQNLRTLIIELVLSYRLSKGGFGPVNTGWSIVFLCHDANEIYTISNMKSFIFKDNLLWKDV